MSPFTGMCGPSAASPPMSSAAASHAKTFPARALKPGWAAAEAVYGQNLPGSFATFDRATSSWKTYQRCFLEEWEPFLETWPRSGMTRSGIAFLLPTLASPKGGIGSGLLPTLIAGDAKGARNGTASTRDLSSGLTLTDWLWLNVGRGMVDPGSAEQLMGFPIGWTELEPSAMPSSPKSRKSSEGLS
jgi:hypothetical protein